MDAKRSNEIIYRVIATSLTRDVGEFTRVEAVEKETRGIGSKSEWAVLAARLSARCGRRRGIQDAS